MVVNLVNENGPKRGPVSTCFSCKAGPLETHPPRESGRNGFIRGTDSHVSGVCFCKGFPHNLIVSHFISSRLTRVKRLGRGRGSFASRGREAGGSHVPGRGPFSGTQKIFSCWHSLLAATFPTDIRTCHLAHTHRQASWPTSSFNSSLFSSAIFSCLI